MDGQRPREELCDAQNLGRVLKFPSENRRDFVVEEIRESSKNTLITVVRPLADDRNVRTVFLPDVAAASLLTI